MCCCVCVCAWRGCLAVSTVALRVKVSLCCQGLSSAASRPGLSCVCTCVCVCEADGKVDLKWTGIGNRRRAFLLAERRMESSGCVCFIFMNPLGRMNLFVFKQVFTFDMRGSSLRPGTKPV